MPKTRKINLTFKCSRQALPYNYLSRREYTLAQTRRAVIMSSFGQQNQHLLWQKTISKSTFYCLCIDYCAGRCRAITIVRFCVWSANLERIIKWSTARTNLFRVVLYLKTSCHHGTLRKHYTTTMNPNVQNCLNVNLKETINKNDNDLNTFKMLGFHRESVCDTSKACLGT